MQIPLRYIIFIGIALCIDWYFYQSILTLNSNASGKTKTTIAILYWSIPIIAFMFFTFPLLFNSFEWSKPVKVYVLGILGILFISKLIGSLFIAMDDIVRLFKWIIDFINPTNQLESTDNKSISRLHFFSQLAVGMAALPFITFIYGMFKSAFDFKIHSVPIILPNLPNSFNGLKIVQISDIHTGSFVSDEPLQKAVELINAQKPDLVLFTGDLVNDRASEVSLHIEALSKISAPMGVFSVLGNHDYGDYAQWESPMAKAENLAELKRIHHKMGWRLLMNEHVSLTRGMDEIALIGIENWGANLNFPKYGDLHTAHSGTENFPVKLLLSHDPSHWEAQVQKEFKDIDITFSGHTHGFQFGIEIPGWIKWSPSKYIYKQWAGLYQKGQQYIYVNRGLGFLGYPGRVGILPEITVMELRNA